MQRFPLAGYNVASTLNVAHIELGTETHRELRAVAGRSVFTSAG